MMRWQNIEIVDDFVREVIWDALWSAAYHEDHLRTKKRERKIITELVAKLKTLDPTFQVIDAIDPEIGDRDDAENLSEYIGYLLASISDDYHEVEAVRAHKKLALGNQLAIALGVEIDLDAIRAEVRKKMNE